MTLYEAEKGASYLIKGLYVEPNITRRLQALGLNDGTIINVLNRKKRGALIIQVRGTRLALGKHISSNIEIKQEEPKDQQVNAGAGKENPEAGQGNAGAGKESRETGQEGSGQEVYK